MQETAIEARLVGRHTLIFLLTGATMSKFLSSIVALGALFAFAQPAHANWQEQLQAQTQIKSGAGFAELPGSGYSLVDIAQTELLAASGESMVSVTLTPGSDYVILGVCDNDCLDLDLALMKGGMELDKDTTTDDWPLLRVTPTSSGNYQVKVTMYNCSTGVCGYQLSVWKR